VSGIEARALEKQRGLNDRHFWARSFRSYVIERDAVWHQKLQYLHLNPVRRSLCQTPEEYRWSSARMFAAGMWNEELGLACNDWRALEGGDDGLEEVPLKASTREGVEALLAFDPEAQASTRDGVEALLAFDPEAQASTREGVEAFNLEERG
jgi:hypothetical protein